eukprot:PITA_05539
MAWKLCLPIECESPSLQMGLSELLPATSEEEKRLLYLAQLDETRRDAPLAIETHAKRMKAQYDRNVTPRNFSEGDLVLLYDQANDKIGAGKFVPMWHEPYIVKRKLAKGAYELVDFGDSLGKPRNGLYLKRCRCLSKRTLDLLMALFVVHGISLPQLGLSIRPLTS